MDDCLGEVVVPLSSLVSNEEEGGDQDEVSGFFTVRALGKGSWESGSSNDLQSTLFGGLMEGERSATKHPQDSLKDQLASRHEGTMAEERGDDPKPEVFLRMQITLKERGAPTTDVEKESSNTIAQELSEVMHTEEGHAASGSGVVGGAVGTVRSAMQTARWIQNLISRFVDLAESVFNIFNWADVHKSMLFFVGLTLLWFFLIIVKTRYIFLVCGLQQFLMGLYLKLTKEQRRKRRRERLHAQKRRSSRGQDDDEALAIAAGNPMLNLLASIPTNEDLRRCYFWENFRRGLVEKMALECRRREARLREIWKARYSSGDVRVSVKAGEDISWKKVFLVLQVSVDRTEGSNLARTIIAFDGSHKTAPRLHAHTQSPFASTPCLVSESPK